MSTFKFDTAYKFFNSFHRHSPFHRMPDHYKRHLVRMLEEDPTAVHYIPETRKWIKSTDHILSGGWVRTENVPIPLIYPKEFHEGLWGGEAIVKGFKRPDDREEPYHPKVPHWWVPVLKRSVVYSEILDKYLSVVVTERALNLIDQYCGLDNYILKTDVIDLRSTLALKLRSKMLLALARKELYPDDPIKRDEIYEKYKQFIIPEDEAEWLGLTLKEALAKQRAIERQQNTHGPLKTKYRAQLIVQLKEMKLNELEASSNKPEKQKSSWIGRLNPFSKTETGPDGAQKPNS